MKRRRHNHVIKKVPLGYAYGAHGHTQSARSKSSRTAYALENDAYAESDLHRCVALWRAVLTQAIMDAKSRRTRPEYDHIRNTAHYWLFHNRRDFTMVCDLAGLEPGSTRRLVCEAQTRGFIWRAGDGEQPVNHKAMPLALLGKRAAYAR